MFLELGGVYGGTGVLRLGFTVETYFDCGLFYGIGLGARELGLFVSGVLFRF